MVVERRVRTSGIRTLAAERIALRGLVADAVLHAKPLDAEAIGTAAEQTESALAALGIDGLFQSGTGADGGIRLFVFEDLAGFVPPATGEDARRLAIRLAADCIAIHRLGAAIVEGAAPAVRTLDQASRWLQQQRPDLAKALWQVSRGETFGLADLSRHVGARLNLYISAIDAARAGPIEAPVEVAAPAPAPVPTPVPPVETAAQTPGPRALPALARFRECRVAMRGPHGGGAVAFDAAIDMLFDPARALDHADLLRALMASPARLAVLVLDRAVRRGQVDAGAVPTIPLRLAAIRLLTNMNAHESAHRLAIAFYEAGDAAHLSEAERLRLDLLLARIKLRSGRVDEAVAMQRDLYLQHPGRTDAVMHYVVSIFASEPPAATALAAAMLDGGYTPSARERLFLGELCLKAGDRARATGAFLSVAAGASHAPEGMLGLANAALRRGEPANWLAHLQRFGTLTGLEIAGVAGDARPAPFRLIAPDYPARADHPRIAVVMTAFNADATIAHAIESVLAQTLRNIELWVVDDRSTDDTVAIVAAIGARDPRVRLLRSDANCGTYSAKNRALRATNAEFVTLHDSDDWMHPRRLEVQLDALQGGQVCSISDWVRMTETGEVTVRRGGGYRHLNPASTLFPRTLLDRIGYFDEVRTGADAEFLTRIRNACGWASVADTGKCLGIGLHHEASLTTSGVTAFDEHRFSPVRLAYTEAWLEWQLAQLEADKPLALSPLGREFDVPQEILP